MSYITYRTKERTVKKGINVVEVGRATIAYEGPYPTLFLTSSIGAGIGVVTGYLNEGPAGAIKMSLLGTLIGTLIGLTIEALIQILLRT